MGGEIERDDQKKHTAACCISMASFLLNGAVFVISYNRLATPFLSEEQRVLNADFIMSVTVGAFGAVAIATGLSIYMLIRKR